MTDKNSKQKSRTHEHRNGSTTLAIPESGLPRIFEDLTRPFDEFMGSLFPSSVMRSLWAELGGREPTIDIQDRGDHFVLTAELPGFDKRDVQVQVGSNALELKVEKRSEKASKDSDDGRVQRSYSYFHRYLTLPERVRGEKVDGTMKNGILELKLPKAEPSLRESPRRVRLN